ncbi:MAG TPA: hypothetical protein VFS21_18240 [Roseiflexaceae bacterium]|nr:hypothetical protein [Roseiflexaceae bacterium]
MSIPAELEARRRAGWRQTPAARIPDPEAAAALIQQVGLATLYPVSPEIPNLFHAFVGDPQAKTESSWDSPSGEVYTWRWTLGRREAAFYTAIVRGRPTLVAWELLPALLRLRGEQRTPEQVYRDGELSEGAYRIAQALEQAGGALDTGELRRLAGFPTGKSERAAYLKAVEELDTRLLLAKVFSPDEANTDMSHALVSARYPQQVAAARELGREAALDRLLAAYLPAAAYALPTPLARHLKLPEPELRAGLERLADAGRAERAELPGQKGHGYIWKAD